MSIDSMQKIYLAKAHLTAVFVASVIYYGANV